MATSEGDVTQLKEFRSRIDAIDAHIITLIAQRTNVVKQIGDLKKKAGLLVMQPDRVRVVLDDRADKGCSAGLNPKMVKQIWQLIIDEACQIEEGADASSSAD